MSAPADRKMPLQTRMRFAFNVALILIFAYTTYEAWDFQRLARYLPLTVSILALLTLVVSLLIDIVAYRRLGVVAAGDVPSTAALAGSEIKEYKLQAREEAAAEDEDAATTAEDPGRDEASASGSATSTAEEGVVDPAKLELDVERLGPVEDPRIILGRSGRVFLWIVGYVVAISIIGVMAASAAYLVGYLFLEAKTGWKIPVIGTVVILVMMLAMREALNLQWPPYLLRDSLGGILG